MEDSGGGVPVEHLAKIFRPFYTTKLKGTGLGLTNVQKIVDQLGGRVEAKSAEAGSIFSIFIPLEPPAQLTMNPFLKDHMVGSQGQYPDRQN